MRRMGWSWPELDATPEAVIADLESLLQFEHDFGVNEGGNELGPV